MTPPFPALHHLSTLSTMRIRPASPVSRSAVRTRQCPARALPNPERGSSASTLSDEEVECRLAALIDVLSKARPHHCGHHDARQQRACAVFVAAKISRSVAVRRRPVRLRVQHHLPFERMPNGVLVMNQVPSCARGMSSI